MKSTIPNHHHQLPSMLKTKQHQLHCTFKTKQLPPPTTSLVVLHIQPPTLVLP